MCGRTVDRRTGCGFQYLKIAFNYLMEAVDILNKYLPDIDAINNTKSMFLENWLSKQYFLVGCVLYVNTNVGYK
jgi:hypothetical protein